MSSPGENMFPWFCYCDKLKVWYYKLGLGTRKTMKIKVSVYIQYSFLVVTDFFWSIIKVSLYKKCCNMTIFQTFVLFPLLILWWCLYFLDVPFLFLHLLFCVHCYFFFLTLMPFPFWNGQSIRLEAQFSLAWNSFV